MTPQEIKRLAHPSEFSRFILTLIVVVPIGLFLVILTFATFGLALLYVLVIMLAFWFGTSLFIAYWMNNAVKVTHDNFSEVYDYIGLAKDIFSYEGRVDAYVYQDGTYNAAMAMLLRKRAILINSELLVEPEFRTEVKFIVGRFVGALAAKHHRFLWFEVLINSIERIAIFNIFLMPYERAVQYSGDQLGLYFINGDLQAGLRSLLKLMVGRDIADQVNINAVLRQEIETRGQFFVLLARIFSSFPHMTSRMANLVRFGHEVFPEETQRFMGKLPQASQTMNDIFPKPQGQDLLLYAQSTSHAPIAVNRCLQIGRTDQSDLYIAEAGVSRQHAMIEPAGVGRISVTDLNSANGTYVNGQRITNAKVQVGDVIRFGDIEFDVSR